MRGAEALVTPIQGSNPRSVEYFLKNLQHSKIAQRTPVSEYKTNFGGFAYPFLHHNLTKGKETRLIAVKSTACPTLTRGKYAFEAGILFARAEGIVPCPEPAHAIRIAIDEALRCKATGEQKVIAFNLSGHSNFDMSPYTAYFQGKLENYYHSEDALQQAMTGLPQVGA